MDLTVYKLNKYFLISGHFSREKMILWSVSRNPSHIWRLEDLQE